MEEKEFCAISKEAAKKAVAKLINANKEIFEEFFMWQGVLATDVKMDAKPVEEFNPEVIPEADETK